MSVPVKHSADEELPVSEIMRQLSGELPLNDFGLPTGIYRSDLLPFHLWNQPLAQEPGVTSNEEPAVSEDRKTSNVQAQSESAADSNDVPDTFEADPFLLLKGEGDGNLDTPLPTPTPTHVLAPTSYRIAGFPSDAIQNAFVPLQYDEGFPAFEDGRAFWSKMDYEPSDAFMAFDRYLKMNFGRRADPEDEDDYGEAASGTRSLGNLVQLIQPIANDSEVIQFLNKYQEYYHLYYWGMRAKAYDLFRITQYRQQQELRAIETQDDHYIQSRKLRARLQQYMESEEEFWELMTPKVAVDMLKQLTQLERISAGVPAAGPQTKDEGHGQSFEVAFRSFAQKHHGEQDGGATIDEHGHVLDKALEDPNAVEILQELIIRSGGKHD